MKVERLPPEVIGLYLDGGTSSPVVVYGGIENQLLHACGGMAWDEGRCWLWLDTFGDISDHTYLLIRWARRLLRQARQLGEKEVFVWRDEQHASSHKLLTLLGFEMCGCDAETGKEIYACPVWKP